MRERNAETCVTRRPLLFVVSMTSVPPLSTLAQMRGGTVARVAVETGTKAGSVKPPLRRRKANAKKAKNEARTEPKAEARFFALRAQNDRTCGIRRERDGGLRQVRRRKSGVAGT